jgi:hypothetical protein
MDSLSTHVFPIEESGGWGVRVKTGEGLAVEYHYSTESQARFMAAVVKLQPSRLPPAQKIVTHLKKRKNPAKRAAQLDGITSEEIDEALGALAEPAETYDFEDDGLGIQIEVEETEEVVVAV